MPSQEILDAIEASRSARGKRQALNDLCDYLQKYVHKLDRQLNDLTRKYEKLKKAGVKDREFYLVVGKRKDLQCQIIEALQLQKEFLERNLQAGDDVIKAHDHFDKLYSQEIEQPSSQSE